MGTVEHVAVLIGLERCVHIVGVTHVIVGGRVAGGSNAQCLNGTPDESQLEVDTCTLGVQVVVETPVGTRVVVDDWA